jgi:GTP-binding protein
MESSYITSAQQAHQLPPYELPEVALVGRSNVGKSSLINALLGRAALARVSSTPGRTAMVNFFEARKGQRAMIVADLPGYGYSEGPRDARQYWQALVEAYLARPNVTDFLFLLDLRRATELGAEDEALLTHLARACKGGAGRKAPRLTIVLTKADKASQAERNKVKSTLPARLAALGLGATALLTISVLKSQGLDALRETVFRHLEPPPEA